MSIGVIIPSIPPRRPQLLRALRSVGKQTMLASDLSVAIDTERAGAPATRQRALDGLSRDVGWVAPLDDDDEFLPFHLEATRFVCGERERELLELKGPCANGRCRLHYAHSGPCDIKDPRP